MKKIKLFSLAVLASIGMSAMAQAPKIVVPSGTLALPTTGLGESWSKNGVTTDVPYVNDETNGAMIFNANALYSSSKDKKQSWTANTGGGTTGKDWAATDIFKGNTYWGSNNSATVRKIDDRLLFYRVNNCIGAKALVQSGSNKKRTVILEAYELTGGVAAATPVKADSMESSTTNIIEIGELDASKEYIIALYAITGGSGGSSEGNSTIFEVAFLYPAGPAAVDDATLKAVTIDGEAISVSDVMSVELPYGTTTVPTVAATATSDKASVVITPATTLPGATTIEVTAEDGTTKKTYTVNFTIGAFKCGEIIKAVHTGSTTATVTGVIGGSVDKNTQSGGKLGSNGHYFGIKLANGKFQAGDIVTVVASKVEGGNAIDIFSDKGKTRIIEASVPIDTIAPAVFILPEAVEWIYIYRLSSATNPSIDYITVNRPCEADIASFTIAGVTAEIDHENMTITASLPYGTTLTAEDWNSAYVLSGPATEATYTIDGGNYTAIKVGEKTYTLNITIAAEQSSNNNITGITVNGKEATLNEDNTYSYVLAFGTTAIPEVVATPEDATATVAYSDITTVAGTVIITVTAQNGDKKEYTLTITVAPAPKDLLDVIFSNGAKGAIKNGNITVPYLAGEDEPVYQSVNFASGVEGATAAMVEGKLVVTGADEAKAEYTITKVALSASAETNVEITFDSTETYIFAPYGWDSAKGWKFAKNTEEASNKRVSEGRTRIYMALPAADSVALVSGSGEKRDVKIYVNNVESGITKTAESNKSIVIALDKSKTNFVAIESNQTGGDGGFVKMQVYFNNGIETALDNIEALDTNAPMYNVLGMQVDKTYKGIVIQGGKKFMLK